MDLRNKKFLTIAPAPPEFSEVWLTRMNELLGEENAFITLRPSESYTRNEALSPNSTLPNKIHLLLCKKTINKNLQKVLLTANEDLVILCHYITTAIILWPTLSSLKNKIYVHCHGHDVTWDRRVEKFPLLPAHGFSYKRNARKLIGKVQLIANSMCTKDKLLEFGYPESSITVKHLSVNTDEMCPTEKSKSDNLRILYLGRLIDCKGPLETIKAFEMAADMGLDAHLDVVGDGPMMKTCLRAYKSSPHKNSITIHGSANREKALEFFRSADIFTAHNKMSSKTRQEEAFGVSIIEAMAFGIPVTTGASGGVIETVLHRETGILFNPGDVRAHANALYEIYRDSDLRARLGSNGRRRAVQKFSSKQDKKALHNILKSSDS